MGILTGIFKDNTPQAVVEKLKQPRTYNRSERRKHAFIMMNENGRFGKWNKLLKQIDWEDVTLNNAAMYSYDTITTMFKIDVSKDVTVVKVVRGKDGKRKFDI